MPNLAYKEEPGDSTNIESFLDMWSSVTLYICVI